MGDEAVQLVYAVPYPLLNEVEGVKIPALPVLHAVCVHAHQGQFLPPDGTFVKGYGPHVVAYLDEGSPGLQQPYRGVV